MEHNLELINIAFNKLLDTPNLDKVKSVYIKLMIVYRSQVVTVTFVRSYNPYSLNEEDYGWYFKGSDYKN